MKELDLISFIKKQNLLAPGVVVGPGDDAAVFEMPGGGLGVITTDATVEGAHFVLDECSGYEVGWKSVARNISDIAAMGAKPLVMVCALCMKPGVGDEFFSDFYRGITECAAKYSSPLVGGDITSGKIVSTTVTIVGVCGGAGPVLRSGARPGDAVCVTGSLGGSRLGKHLRFEPRLFEAAELVSNYDVHSMIDISDGLSTDILHIAEESGVGVILDAEKIPVSDDAGKAAKEDGRAGLEHALADGEDFELLFTMEKSPAEELVQTGLAGTPVTIIGRITELGEGCSIKLQDGSICKLKRLGYEHTA